MPRSHQSAVIFKTLRVTVLRRKSGIIACRSASSFASVFDGAGTVSCDSAVALNRTVTLNDFASLEELFLFSPSGFHCAG